MSKIIKLHTLKVQFVVHKLYVNMSIKLFKIYVTLLFFIIQIVGEKVNRHSTVLASRGVNRGVKMFSIKKKKKGPLISSVPTKASPVRMQAILRNGNTVGLIRTV